MTYTKADTSLILKQWTDNIIRGRKPRLHLGIDNTIELIEFLNSPEGKATLAEIAKQYHLQIVRDENRKFELREKEILKHRLAALLFLSYLKEDARAEQLINDIIFEQDQAKQKQQSIPASSSEQSKTDAQRMEEIREFYEEAYKQAQQRDKILEKQLIDLQSEKEKIETKYSEFENTLELEQFNKFLNIEKKDGDNTDILSNEITDIKSKLEEGSNIISSLLENNKEDEAHIELNKQNALNLKLAMLLDIQSISKDDNTHYFVDAEGKNVDSLQQAHFILNKDLKKVIIKEGANYYLLSEHQREHFNTLSIEEKNQAAKDFERKKPELLFVPKLVAHNKHLETRDVHERMDHVKTQLHDNREVLMLLDNQRNLIQSALVSTDNEIPKITPKPTGNSKTPSNRPSFNEYKKDYQNLIQSSPTLNDLNQFIKNNRTQIKMSDQEIKSILKNAPRNGPIPFQLFQSIIKNLERLGFDGTPDNITSNKGPLEQQLESEKNPPTAPNPFQIKPTPNKS